MFVRSFHATSSRLSSALTRARISKLLAILSKETREPLWQAVRRQRIPFDEFTQVTGQHDIESALKTLETSQVARIPPWVVFYLILYKVRSSVHADGPMIDFLFDHLSHLPLGHQGPLLIFAALHLSKFNLLQPLKRVVNTFLTTELSHEALQFNLLLQALSLNSVRSPESADLVVQILNAMDGRQVKLRPDTYRALLNDRFITVQLTKHLRSRMTHEGVVPDAGHLESYLRVFAKGGAIHETQTYFNALRRRRESSPSVYAPESTVALSAFKDRASAFDFLEKLAPALRAGPRPFDPYVLHLNKKRLDSHNFTASLAVVARDPEMSIQNLMRMFRRMGTMRGSAVRPTIVSYTVVIRGLLYRNSVKNAERLWNEVVRGRYVLDRPAVTVGVETLTYAGKAREAFELLEKSGYREPRLTPMLSRGGVVDIHVVNSFMAALTKMKRPDVVFKLWDFMGELYEVYPTSETLSIVLEAARIACQLDDTLHGALSHLSLRNPFRRPVQQPSVREEMVESIRGVVGEPYSCGIWNDARPFDAMRVVFLQAVWHEKLVDVEPPAFALRRSLDADDMVLPGLPATKPCEGSSIELPPNLLNGKGRSWYPHIIPSNENFQKYLLLLGLNKRAYEIPITLGWMRALEVRPDKATLAIAMVFWAEVSRHAPLVEEMTGGEARSEFQRLWSWAEDWVGEDRMPTPDNVGRWLRKTKRMFEGEE
ncbi:hypothetical protein AX14_005594 [Amanita brunnescens Koide BX004]|nr:hypothetical protein AX14_005594 [Amanita brunnescens Koide BX004]